MYQKNEVNSNETNKTKTLSPFKYYLTIALLLFGGLVINILLSDFITNFFTISDNIPLIIVIIITVSVALALTVGTVEIIVDNHNNKTIIYFLCYGLVIFLFSPFITIYIVNNETKTVISALIITVILSLILKIVANVIYHFFQSSIRIKMSILLLSIFYSVMFILFGFNLLAVLLYSNLIFFYFYEVQCNIYTYNKAIIYSTLLCTNISLAFTQMCSFIATL